MTMTTPPTVPDTTPRQRDWSLWLRRGAVAATGLAVALAAAPFLSGLSAFADLLTQFLLQAAAGSTVLVLILAALRWRGLALIVLAALGVQLWILTHYAGLKPAMAAAQATGPKVFALNVWGRNRSYDQVIDLVRREDADVVVLIEVTREWRRALMALKRDYPFHIDCIGNSNCDLMLFSKRKWVSAASLHDRATYASVVEARIEFEDGPLTVIGTHLMRPIGLGDLDGQMAQTEVLARRIEAASGRKIVVGDFNAVPWGRVVTTLETRTGLRVLPGLEGTWPAPMPWPLRLPIDNAMVSADVAVASRRIGPPVGSDHAPVIVQLARTPG